VIKMASLLTMEYLRREAVRGNRADFEWFLRAITDRVPAVGDEINGRHGTGKTWSVS